MAPTLSAGSHLPAAVLGRSDCARKRSEARAREAPEAIPGKMEGVLGGRCLPQGCRIDGSRIAAKPEGDEGVIEMQALNRQSPAL